MIQDNIISKTTSVKNPLEIQLARGDEANNPDLFYVIILDDGLEEIYGIDFNNLESAIEAYLTIIEWSLKETKYTFTEACKLLINMEYSYKNTNE